MVCVGYIFLDVAFAIARYSYAAKFCNAQLVDVSQCVIAGYGQIWRLGVLQSLVRMRQRRRNTVAR